MMTARSSIVSGSRADPGQDGHGERRAVLQPAVVTSQRM